MSSQRYSLRRPCAHCPFRTDVPGFLRPERAMEIAEALMGGGEFPCHKTTESVEDENGDCQLVPGENSRFCAGAMIVLERMQQPNQMMRIAERLGMYDHTKLDMDAPVAADLSEFIRHHAGEEPQEHEPCNVAAGGCLAPAGYMMNGVVVEAVVSAPTTFCEQCGTSMCGNCQRDGDCLDCATA